MNTFKDLYWQTTYKRALINSYKKERATTSLHAIIMDRGHCEQAMAVLHPHTENVGKRATRCTIALENMRINSID
jgi:hypothetical protein